MNPFDKRRFERIRARVLHRQPLPPDDVQFLVTMIETLHDGAAPALPPARGAQPSIASLREVDDRLRVAEERLLKISPPRATSRRGEDGNRS